MLQDNRIRQWNLKSIQCQEWDKCDFKENQFEIHFVEKDNLVFVFNKKYELQFVSYCVTRAIRSLEWCNKEYNKYFTKGSEA